MEYKIKFYENKSKKHHALDFMNYLETENNQLWKKMNGSINKIKNSQYHRMPIFRSLDKGLFEVRAHSRTDISRITCCFGKNRIIYLLHGFIKKTDKTPLNELSFARKLQKELKERRLM